MTTGSAVARWGRCPQTLYVTVRANDVGLVWPVKTIVRCVRHRWHPGPCRSKMVAPTRIATGQAIGWEPVVWWKPLGWLGLRLLDAPWREPWRRVAAKLRAATRAGPRRQSPPPP